MRLRRFWKPECISAVTERAIARATGSAGSRPGRFSARYSPIASESHTTTPWSFRQGTLPAGECDRMRSRLPGMNSEMRISSKVKQPSRAASQARRDQEE